MRSTLSVSNIAWPPDAQYAAIEVLRSLGVASVEVAPFNVFGTWDIGLNRVRAFRDQLNEAGMVCSAMQGIVFNVSGAHLFQSTESRDRLCAHLERIARIAGVLGAKACVFGAPRLRDPGDLSREQAFDIATEFLRAVGPAFAAEGSVLAFEPNATAYGCRFVTTTTEAIDLVAHVASSGIGLQIDTGTVFLENEDPCVLSRAVPFAAHAHISEPGLAPIGTSSVDHGPLAHALAVGAYFGTISIEMKSTPEWRADMARAVTLARQLYLS